MHAANMGHADAMRNVGRIYAYSHIFTTSDRSQAMIWLNKSIELDNSDAYLDLSNLYREGIGTNKNDSLALEYAKKSALMGNEIGMYNTGLYYLEPQKHDVTSAMSWFKQAAALGDVHSMSMIGFLYLYGNANGLDPNIDSAQLYLQKAVDSGDSHSMSLLGLSYIQCDKDKQNHALARKWFYRAADSGNSQAMNFIGVMYELGVGVIRNCNESVYWYEKAIALKNTDAMVNYGIHFINGCTQTKDINETLKWFNKALELNPRSAFAHIELGDVYSNGKYLPKDLALAKTHYQAAVELGNVYAKKRLEKLTQ
jgi:TPR repeat protein